jgi:mycothiol system anti-sigma-R factor
MTCAAFAARLDPYVDGELGADETARGDAHVAACARCAALVEQDRALRHLLRRQPRETAPAALRERIGADVRRVERRQRLAPWVVAPAIAAAVVLVLLAVRPAREPAAPFVGTLVDTHIVYAQVDRPEELASSDARQIREWFRARAALRVTVPDFSGDGIQLVGARLADAHERSAAYLLYRKGMTLMSVFMVPAAPPDATAGRSVTYRGEHYRALDWKGHRTVTWRDGDALFGLVGMLDYDALLECAGHLRADRAAERRS